MLTQSSRRRSVFTNDADPIHNHYEHLVMAEIFRTSDRARNDINFLADVACVALNHLPPRYIRHDVDMTFFMSPLELEEIERKTATAVADAMRYVEQRESEKQVDNDNSIKQSPTIES